jgi:hypothetical protein
VVIFDPDDIFTSARGTVRSMKTVIQFIIVRRLYRKLIGILATIPHESRFVISLKHERLFLDPLIATIRGEEFPLPRKTITRNRGERNESRFV